MERFALFTNDFSPSCFILVILHASLVYEFCSAVILTNNLKGNWWPCSRVAILFCISNRLWPVLCHVVHPSSSVEFLRTATIHPKWRSHAYTTQTHIQTQHTHTHTHTHTLSLSLSLTDRQTPRARTHTHTHTHTHIHSLSLTHRQTDTTHRRIIEDKMCCYFMALLHKTFTLEKINSENCSDIILNCEKNLVLWSLQITVVLIKDTWKDN